MNPAQLLAHFDCISEAPDAIPRLRRFILDLAVRGKLVEQDPVDEPASELLKRIQVKKARLLKEGRMKKQGRLPSVEPQETWKVPSNWVFVPLETLTGTKGFFTDGDWVESKDQDPDGDVRLIQLADVGVGVYRNRSSRFMTSASAARLNCTYLNPGDILIARMPDPLGRACIFPGDPKPSVTVVDVAILRLGTYDLDSAYVVHAINSPPFVQNVESKAAGATRSRISRSNLSLIPFPLPPLAEQHRIVAKVDELMAVCDRLEAAQADRERRRDRLVAASLQRLNNGADAQSFREHARFHLSHLPRLTTRPAHIQQLRQTILNLAVRGQLLPQDPNDEPASELLKRIQAEKARLVKEGRIRKEQLVPSLEADEMPFELPNGWRWLRVGEIGFTQTGTTPSSNNPEYFGNYIPFVKPADLTGNFINYSGEGISKEGVVHSRLIPKNSVLMVCIGSSIGKVNVNDRNVCCNQQINTVTPYIEHLTRFTSFALKADYFQKLILANAGMGTLPIISKGKWEILPIPLSPLAEQYRIVAKVEELLALCDRLEAQLTTAQTENRLLLEAILHQAMAPVPTG